MVFIERGLYHVGPFGDFTQTYLVAFYFFNFKSADYCLRFLACDCLDEENIKLLALIHSVGCSKIYIDPLLLVLLTSPFSTIEARSGNIWL